MEREFTVVIDATLYRTYTMRVTAESFDEAVENVQAGYGYEVDSVSYDGPDFHDEPCSVECYECDQEERFCECEKNADNEFFDEILA